MSENATDQKIAEVITVTDAEKLMRQVTDMDDDYQRQIAGIHERLSRLERRGKHTGISDFEMDDLVEMLIFAGVLLVVVPLLIPLLERLMELWSKSQS